MPEYDELIKACRKNKHEKVLRLLQDHNIGVNMRNRDGDTPIIFAASSCHKETLQILLQDERVDLNIINRFGENLEAMVGCVSGTSDQKKEILRMIKEERLNRETRKQRELAAELRRELRQLEDEQRRMEEQHRILEEQQNMQQSQVLEQIQQLELEHELKIEHNNINEKKMTLSSEDALELEETRNLAKSVLNKKIEKYSIKINEDKELLKKINNNENNDKNIKSAKNNSKSPENYEKEEDRLKRSISSMELAVTSLKEDLKKMGDNCQREFECPVCLEMMRPPTKIWHCEANHLICAECKDKLGSSLCPTCRIKPIFGRAISVEAIARSLFCH